MFRKLVFIFCVGIIEIVNSSEAQLPKIIDFGKFPTIEQGYYSSFDEELWELGCYAFNYASELTPFFLFLKTEYEIDAVVETGTFHGGTTILFPRIFNEVHTIEVDEVLHSQDSKRLKNHTNVFCHLGSSENVLTELLPSLTQKRVLFYLDAHWGAFWPLLDELKSIRARKEIT